MRYVILLLALLFCAAPILAQPFANQTASTAVQGTFQVYPNGVATFTVPASQYLDVATSGSGNARVWQQVGGLGTSFSAKYTEMTGSPVSNGETVFGPFTNATIVKIESQADPVYYSVGANGVSYPCIKPGTRLAFYQATPIAYTSASTLLSSDLMDGLITVNTTPSSSTATMVLPTGTLLDAATNLQIGQAFEWSIINLNSTSGGTLTITAGTGDTIVGDTLVQIAGASTGCATARYRSRKTAANTFITYRVQ